MAAAASRLAFSHSARTAGIRYESRIRTGWECWALLDDQDVDVLETLPITPDMPALAAVAGLFDLQVF